MREGPAQTAQEEIMGGGVTVLIGRQVHTGEVDQVLIMGAPVALCMIGTLGHPMTGQGALLMGDIAGNIFSCILVQKNGCLDDDFA